MKTFRIKIKSRGYFCDFTIECEDSSEALENAIVDKLGENVIKWEYVGDNVYASDKYRITYEEVINDDATTHPGTLQQEKVAGSQMGARAS